MTSPGENLFLSQTTFSSRVRVEQFCMFPLGNHNSWYFPWPKKPKKKTPELPITPTKKGNGRKYPVKINMYEQALCLFSPSG